MSYACLPFVGLLTSCLPPSLPSPPLFGNFLLLILSLQSVPLRSAPLHWLAGWVAGWLAGWQVDRQRAIATTFTYFYLIPFCYCFSLSFRLLTYFYSTYFSLYSIIIFYLFYSLPFTSTQPLLPYPPLPSLFVLPSPTRLPNDPYPTTVASKQKPLQSLNRY